MSMNGKKLDRHETSAFGARGQSDSAGAPTTRPPNLYITLHARRKLQERWPDTVLRPRNLDGIVVPGDSLMLGYDPSRSARYLLVSDTPMVAVVVADTVTTFLTVEQAKANLYLRGYWFEEIACRRKGA
jgi:hypothetical protein